MFAAINARSPSNLSTVASAATRRACSGLLSRPNIAAISSRERRKPGEPSYMLRPHQPGDMGWIIHRHGVLYAEEYGLDESFEAMVARIAATFIENFDTRRERCWIAERDGEVGGSVLLVNGGE